MDARNHGLLRAGRTDMPHQRPSIDTFDADDARALEVIAKRHFGAPVRRPRPALLDDEAFDVDAARLFVRRVDSNVPNFGIRHANNLSLVRRISEHLLVASHRGVKHDFARGLADRAEGITAKDAAVREREYGLLAFA